MYSCRINHCPGVWLRSPHKHNTIYWGVFREKLDKLKKDCKGKAIPLMHTWHYQHSTYPNTTTNAQPYDAIQLPTAYECNAKCV